MSREDRDRLDRLANAEQITISEWVRKTARKAEKKLVEIGEKAT